MARGLTLDDVADDPVEQFGRWYADAEEAGLHQPHAMVVATVGADGRPSARFVLLRGHGPDGFRFFTDRSSVKGTDLLGDPRVALLFPWHELSRQVRIEGRAAPVGTVEADEYWATRPRGSQLAARASDQSAPVADRAELDRRYAAAEAEYEGTDVPRPERWGGFRVEPDHFEFWQGRENRFHDRIVYRPRGDGTWELGRLQP